MKHTSGPWEITQSVYAADHRYFVSRKDRFSTSEPSVIATVESQANARLIAVAPEMLTNLELIERWMMSAKVGGDLLKQIQGVIKKARGES